MLLQKEKSITLLLHSKVELSLHYALGALVTQGPFWHWSGSVMKGFHLSPLQIGGVREERRQNYSECLIKRYLISHVGTTPMRYWWGHHWVVGGRGPLLITKHTTDLQPPKNKAITSILPVISTYPVCVVGVRVDIILLIFCWYLLRRYKISVGFCRWLLSRPGLLSVTTVCGLLSVATVCGVLYVGYCLWLLSVAYVYGLLSLTTVYGYCLWATVFGYCLWATVCGLLYLATVFGYCLWLLYVATVCGLLSVATVCGLLSVGYCLLLLSVITVCGYCLWLLSVATFFRLLYLASVCGYCLCLLSVATFCGYCMVFSYSPY